MKVTAITRYKQGDIYLALQKLGWTQAELAKRTGIHYQTLGTIINLRKKPNKSQLDKIQAVFADEGVFVDVVDMFPPGFKPLNPAYKAVQTKEIVFESLLDHPEVLELEYENSEAEEADAEITRHLLEGVLVTLKKKSGPS